MMTPREFAIDVVRRLSEAGFEALWAGGCVRDELLGIHPADYDVATNARPEEVQKLFRRTLAIGEAFGVIEVIGPKHNDKYLNVQVATFRSDGTYSDGRRPDSVTYGTAEADAQRRDFTINGLFFDPLNERVIDFVEGQKDLVTKLLRAIGNPVDRFSEDKLRILRAVRMATRFDLTIDHGTLLAARSMAHEIHAVSAERIAEELRKLLSHPQRGKGAVLLLELNLVAAVFQELQETWTAKVISQLPADADFPLAFASLMIAIPIKTARTICLRLRLSNDEIRKIIYLVENAEALKAAEQLKPSQLYPLLSNSYARDLIALHRACGWIQSTDHCEEIRKRTPREVLNPEPLITGDDLTQAGYKPGPVFKSILDRIRSDQLDGLIHSSADAIGLAERLHGSR